MKRMIAILILGLAVTGLVFKSNAGTAVPKGCEKQMMAGTDELEATGCGIVKADDEKTTIKIKCEACGYEDMEKVIDTPAADKPYAMEFTCPKCKHIQKTEIMVNEK